MSSSTSSRYRESAAVTAPTKVNDQSNTSFAEEHALDAIAKEAELRLQHQREQNREARQLRHKELEKNARDDGTGSDSELNNTDQNLQEEKEELDKEDDATDSTSAAHAPSTSVGSTRSRIMSIDGANNNALGTNANSLLLQKFLNGDVDPRSIEQRDLRRLLSELETKYKAAMIANSSMYNEKQALRYQVETFKDTLDEHYETLNQAKRQVKEKSKDLDLQKRAFNELQQEHNQLKEILASREKLIQESGMQLLTGDEINGVNSEENVSSVLPIGLVSQETLTLLNSLGKGSIDQKLKRILNEKREQFEQIVKLKSELDEEKNRLRTMERQIPKFHDTQNVNGSIDSEQQKQLTKEITELKNRLQRVEADNSSLQQENKRYDAQLNRQKKETEELERIAEELKQERRRLQREVRAAREEIENERTRSDVLQRENERLRTLRKKNLLSNEESFSLSSIVSRSHTNSPLPATISSSSSSSISTTNDLQFNPSIQDPP